eukprot:scaffold25920_cov64-Phaeocystis_antarctica.AAC.1
MMRRSCLGLCAIISIYLSLSIYLTITQVREAHVCNSGFPDWKEAGYPTTTVEEPWPTAQCMST